MFLPKEILQSLRSQKVHWTEDIFSLILQLHVPLLIRENDFKLKIFHGNKLKFRSEMERVWFQVMFLSLRCTYFNKAVHFQRAFLPTPVSSY